MLQCGPINVLLPVLWSLLPHAASTPGRGPCPSASACRNARQGGISQSSSWSLPLPISAQRGAAPGSPDSRRPANNGVPGRRSRTSVCGSKRARLHGCDNGCRRRHALERRARAQLQGDGLSPCRGLVGQRKVNCQLADSPMRHGGDGFLQGHLSLRLQRSSTCAVCIKNPALSAVPGCPLAYTAATPRHPLRGCTAGGSIGPPHACSLRCSRAAPKAACSSCHRTRPPCADTA